MCYPEWNALPQDKQDAYGYEHELCIFLEALIRSCDKNVEKARDAHERGATDVTAQEAQQLLDLDTKIAEIQKRSKLRQRSGDVAHRYHYSPRSTPWSRRRSKSDTWRKRRRKS